MANVHGVKMYFSDGLKDQDDRLDDLTNLFEQLQCATIDACHPELDLITFAQNAHLFCVILKDRFPQTNHSMEEGERRRQDRTVDLGAATPTRKHALIDPSSFDQHRKYLRANFTDQPTQHHPPQHHENAFILRSSPWHNPLPIIDPQRPLDAIGLVYLFSPHPGHPLHENELNIGIILDAQYRGLGDARRALERVLDIAFLQLHCHRVQAILPDHVARDRAIWLFINMGFTHEGIRRRAFFSPIEQEYKNATYMGILDTEWIMRKSFPMRAAPCSVWDELFARHTRERQELLDWENNFHTSSVATICGASTPPVSVASLTDDITEEEENTKTSNTVMAMRDTGMRTAQSEHDSESYYSTASSERSVSPAGYISAASSSWDVLIPSSPSSWSSASFDL